MFDTTKPLVSVVCPVYNHEPYLRQCLDGIVMQKTNFSFEVIVNDDASTDGSADILRDYQYKYPDLIKPIYQIKNQYSQGKGILATILFPRTQGKYIAVCEGDDYWTDPLKLQKQVDYMEAHPECTLCFHNALVHWYDGSKPDKLFADVEERDYSGPELVNTWYSPTASFLFTSFVKDDYIVMMRDYPKMNVGDMPLLVCCARKGVIHGFQDVMSVYGKHAGSYTQFSDAIKTYNIAISWEERGKAFGNEYKNICRQFMTGLYLNALFRSIREKNFLMACKCLYRGILRQPVTGIKALIRIPQEKRARIKNNT